MVVLLAYVEGDTMYVIPAMTNVKDLVRYADNDMEKFGKMNVNTENNFLYHYLEEKY